MTLAQMPSAADWENAPPPLTRNNLLAAIPEAERRLVESRATFVLLKRRDLLSEPETPRQHVYFLVDGIASMLAVMTDGTGVETATIGREGMVGMPVFHGVLVTSDQTMVQVPGAAYRLDAAVFQSLLPELPSLSALLHRFSVVLFTLAAQSSGCNRKHSVEARCARWLLLVADRLGRERLELTHDFVAQMLGVRRASVTEVLGSFEDRGFVAAGRGRITIVDRPALEAATCECYGIVRATTRRLLEGIDERSPLADVALSADGKSTVREPCD